MDDEKILFNNETNCINQDGMEEVMHIRAAEYFSLGHGISMVGIRITRGGQTKQYVDVTKELYDKLGLGALVLRAIGTREKTMEIGGAV